MPKVLELAAGMAQGLDVEAAFILVAPALLRRPQVVEAATLHL